MVDDLHTINCWDIEWNPSQQRLIDDIRSCFPDSLADSVANDIVNSLTNNEWVNGSIVASFSFREAARVVSELIEKNQDDYPKWYSPNDPGTVTQTISDRLADKGWIHRSNET